MNKLILASDNAHKFREFSEILSGTDTEVILRSAAGCSFEIEETGNTFYAAFNPNQIKSATDNNGMFSTENDDIQMAVENNSEKNNIFAQNSYIYINETKNAAKTAGEIFQETYKLLERKSESSDSKSQSLREGIREEARKQQSIILNWAKNNGKLL